MAKKRPVRVAVIGCGSISGIYMENLSRRFAIVELVGCSDLIPERAEKRAQQFGIRAMTNAEIYADPSIEMVMNLTFPEAHFEVSRDALRAGKHVAVEKMMAVTLDEAKELADLARSKGLLFGTAPDTFLGGGWQTVRKYVDDGLTGRPVSFSCVCTTTYQPSTPKFDTSPDFFFFPLHPGGGIPYDLGGYYLHNLINLFGSAKRVTGFGGNPFPDRVYSNPQHPKYGEPFHVDTPTSIAGAIEFESGVTGTILFSSDSSNTDSFLVQGTQGSLVLFHPNFYSGRIALRRVGSAPAPMFPPQPAVPPPPEGVIVRGVVTETELPMLHGYLDNTRGIGLADMAYALRNGRRPRMHADLGLHAFEIVEGILRSSKTGRTYEMTTRCERPKAIASTALVGSAQEAALDD